MPKWPSAQIDRLRALATQGLTTTAVAAILGCTKNMVVGQASRAQPRITWTHNAREFYFKPGSTSWNKGRRYHFKNPRIPKEKLEDIHIPKSRMVAFMELNGHDCHWPFGAKPYLFCAVERAADSYYCKYHKAMAIRDFAREPRRKVSR
jgi:hypothetical protein